MHQPSPTDLNSIDVKHVKHFTHQICKYAEKLQNAYENLLTRYEVLSLEKGQRKSGSAKTPPPDPLAPANLSHKRRKTDESIINDSVASNDPLNEAIQDISSCQEDGIIESTPKPDVTRRNVTKKILSSRSPNKRNQIKVEKLNDSKDPSKSEVLRDAQEIKVEKSPDSPLRSVENQSIAGKENRHKPPTKWLSNVLVSPSRVTRSGFITAKSPKGVSRLSLSKPFKQSLLDFAKKPAKEPVADSCAETFFDGTPRRPIPDVKSKFLRQQCIEACVNSSKDSDDESVFNFQSDVKPSNKSTSPPNIKSEPLTGQPTTGSKITIDNQPLPSGSAGSSVIALTGQPPEVIVIQESQPLFDDCSETFCEKLDLNLQAVETLARDLKISDDEKFIANHRLSCRLCELFMDSNPALRTSDKLEMVDRCIKRYPVRPDTDPEFWNPRFVDTPESQKQETLIDDGWSTRKKKT